MHLLQHAITLDRLQRDILGVPGRDVVAVLVVITLLLLGFVTEPRHGLSPEEIDLFRKSILINLSPSK